MASVTRSHSKDKEDEPNTRTTKFPMKRLEISIQRFIKVLSINLDRLQNHMVNLQKLTGSEDLSGLQREQIKATLTVQQVKASIKEIEKARNQVTEEDQQVFDDRVLEVKSKAVNALEDFVLLLNGDETLPESPSRNIPHDTKPDIGKGDLNHESLSQSCFSSLPSFQPSSSPSSSSSPMLDKAMSQSSYHSAHSRPTQLSSNGLDIPEGTGEGLNQHEGPLLLTTNLHAATQNNAEFQHSWEQLRESIEDLNEIVHVFAERVAEQGEVINSIEDNIDSSDINVKKGTSFLAKASKYRAAMFPAMGAVIGGVLGGPVGLVAGVKLGGLAAGIGGAVGFAGGRYMKNRQNKIVEMEMAKMSYSQYIPELSNEDESLTSNQSEPVTELPDNEKTVDQVRTPANKSDSNNSYLSSVKSWLKKS